MERYNHTHESLFSKLIVLPGLLLTTVVALILLAANASHTVSTDGIVQFVNNHRDSVAFIVQVISAIFGIFHVFALQTTLSLSWRSLLERRAFPLYMIKFMDRLENFTPDFSLPLRLVCLLALLYVIGLSPAALWAGAITPVLQSQPSKGQLAVPVFRNSSFLEIANPPNLVNDQGVFGYQAEFYLQGLLLTSAASASPRHNETVVHPKLDSTGYSYVGRSYGVGSSVGLADNFAKNVTDFKFVETGINPQVSCIYNESSAVYFTPQDFAYNSPQHGTLNFVTCNGSLPNGPVTDCFGAAYGSGTPVHASSLHAEDKFYIGFVVGNNTKDLYHPLYQAQCEVQFSAREYSVAVSVTNRTITVEPLLQNSPPMWPANGTKLANQVFSSIDGMSRILSASQFTSVLGNAFVNNIANVAGTGKGGLINGSKASTAQQNLTGIRDSMISLIDNTLVAVNSAQLLIMKDTIATTADLNAQAIGFGTPLYIYAVLGVNFLIVFFFTEELIRTKCWKDLSTFRFGDSIYVAVAASGGGSELYHTASKLMPTYSRPLASEENSEEIKVRLQRGYWPGIPVLILDRSQYETETRFNQKSGLTKERAHQ